MKILSDNSTKKNSVAFAFKNFCRKVSKIFYSLMRACEHLNGDAKAIKKVQANIQEEISDARNIKKEKQFIEENVISKEEHIERLYMFITTLSVNFRNENYEEVDVMFKKINL